MTEEKVQEQSQVKTKDSQEPQSKTKEFTKTFKSISDFANIVIPAMLLKKKDKIKQTKAILLSKLSKYAFTIDLANDEKIFIKHKEVYPWKESKNFRFTHIYRREQLDKEGKKKVYYGIEDKHLVLFINRQELLHIIKNFTSEKAFAYIQEKF